MTLTLPIVGLLSGFVLFVLASIPPLWHKSKAKPEKIVLRAVCWVLAMTLIAMGLLPVLGIL